MGEENPLPTPHRAEQGQSDMMARMLYVLGGGDAVAGERDRIAGSGAAQEEDQAPA